MYGTRNEYLMYGGPEYDPDFKRKTMILLPSFAWSGAMLIFFIYFVGKTSPF